MESTTDVPTESEYKAFQDLRSHLIMLKNGLPYFEESIHPVMEVLKVKDKILNQHNKDAYRLGSTYQSRPFELVDTAPLKKAFEADQFKLHEMKKEISKCSKELEHYRYEWQTIIKPPKEMLKDFFIVRVSPEVNEIFNKHIDYLQDRLDHLKLYENGYYLESCNLNCFLKDMNYYKEHYEKDLVEYKDKIKMYERICEPESRLIDRNKYLGMNYQNINVENIKKMTTDYENILDERISQVEAKRVDNIFDEMLKRELKYKTINFTREHFETVDTARDVMRVEEKMDELYNNGDISGKTHDEVLNHLSEVEEALYERIKDNMENNFLFKTQVENAVNADGEFGYKRALYNQDDVYKDVVKDVLEIDDLQKDADEMEL